MVNPLVRTIIIVFISFPAGIFAQVNKDFVYYNQTTYAQYVNMEWDRLIDTGKEALKNDIDFFYLRIRLGIAYYNKEIFSGAINHFEKSLNFNSGDPVVLEYLYYAYINSDRYVDAILFYRKHKETLKDIIDYRPKFFDRIFTEGGFKISDHNIRFGTETGPITYGQIGLSHVLGGRIYLQHSAEYLSLEFLEKYINQNRYLQYSYNITQFEYYLKASIIPRRGWEFYPVYHLIRVNTPDAIYNDIYASLGLNKTMGRIKMGMSISYSDINGNTIYQYEPKIMYYPYGNNKIYLKSSVIWTSEDVTQRSVNGLLGLKLIDNTWMEAFYTYGKTQYSAFNDGYIIYNNPDYLLSRSGLLLYQYYTPKSSITLSYQLEQREQLLSESRYNHHFILIGLNFKL